MTTEDGLTAVTMADAEGRQHHIGLKKGELAGKILLCGDPDRIEVGRPLFDTIEGEWQRREYRTITGTYKGQRMSLMSTGIGCDNTEIAVIEASEILDSPTFIRVGSCGSIHESIRPGDLVISTGSMAFENTSTFFVPDCYPAIADYRVVRALKNAAEKLGHVHHVGLTATTSGFYGSQGRGMGKFQPLEEFTIEKLLRWQVLNFEMESSTLFRLSMLSGARAGTICAAFNNRITDKIISKEDKPIAEKKTIQTAMEALLNL